jgi:hypothetical protein
MIGDERSFVTGSHAYGEPGPDSDVDLVVFVRPEHAMILRRASEGAINEPIRFGRLNIIAVSSYDELCIWRMQREILEDEAPVARERALEVGLELGTHTTGLTAGRAAETWKEFEAMCEIRNWKIEDGCLGTGTKIVSSPTETIAAGLARELLAGGCSAVEFPYAGDPSACAPKP